MTHRLPEDERLLELLSQRATEGLDASETMDLQRASADVGDDVDIDGLELAAAALEAELIETSGDIEEMPASLTETLIAEGHAFFATDDQPAGTSDALAVVGSIGMSAWLGWVAAAASIALAVTVMLVSGGKETVPTVAEARAALLADAGDVITVAWNKPANEAFAAVAGDVVWSDDRQEGYMKLTGMPINDPRVKQYQLWIVDPDVDKNPVDGGVFDVTKDGEVIIPIDAKLAVANPAAFAITVERPGGVVVSDGPLEVVAAPKS